MSRVDRTGRTPQAAGLWRAVVVLGAAGVTVAATAGVAQALPDADASWTSTLRGLLVAAVAAASFTGAVWGARRALAAAGVPADAPFVPAEAPAWARTLGDRVARSRGAGAVAALVVGMLLGFVGAGLDVSEKPDQVAGDRSVEFENGSSSRDAGDGGVAVGPGSAVAGSVVEGGSPSGDGDGGSASDPGDPATSKDGGGRGSGKGGSGGSDDDDDDGDGQGPGGGGGGPLDDVCDALEEYSGDVDDLLASLGLDAGSLTEADCDEVEAAIEDVEDLLGGVLPEVPTTVPTTLPDLPVPTTVTVPSLPVTTTTITLPSLF